MADTAPIEKTTCEQCGASFVQLPYPHVERECKTCGKTIRICQRTADGGIKIEEGDRFTIPAGYIQLSLHQGKSRGQFFRAGVTWFVQQLFFRGATDTPDKFSTVLDLYVKEADEVLKNSDLLKHLNLESEAGGQEAWKILEQKQDKPEWWATLEGALIGELKKAIDGGNALRAAWFMNRIDCCRSMLIFQSELEATVWRGYTTHQLREVLTLWKENENNGNEEFWQKTIAENAVILSQLFSFPVVLLKDKAYLGGKDISNSGGKLLDFLLSNQLTTGTALVEIKTPTTRLLGSEYRGGVYPASSELAGAITQVLTYKDTFTKEHYVLRGKSQQPFSTFEPQCLVIAGNFAKEIIDPAMHSSLDLFRNSLRLVQVVTYDEMFEKISILLNLLGAE